MITCSARLAIQRSMPWMWTLRVLVDPALVAAVLGRVDRDHERAAEALGEVVAGDRDEPVVAVHDVEVVAVAELDAGGQHVGVHVLDPGDELAELARALAARARGGRCTPSISSSAGDSSRPRVEHVHLDVLARRGSRPACARGARGRPRSAAGTPRRGSGRASASRRRASGASVERPGARLRSRAASGTARGVCQSGQRGVALAARVAAHPLAAGSRPPARA